MALVRETHISGNFCERKRGIQEPVSGTGNPALADIFSGRNMKVAPKRAGKMNRMDSEVICY